MRLAVPGMPLRVGECSEGVAPRSRQGMPLMLVCLEGGGKQSVTASGNRSGGGCAM